MASSESGVFRGRKRLTRRAMRLSSGEPAFSWEMLLLFAERRKVGEPVDADILGYLLK